MGLFLNSSWEWNWEVRGSPHWRAAYFSLVWLLLLLSRFSRVQLLCDSIDGRPLGSPSLGFSRQEHWSGLPFPSPIHESEKWKWSCSVVPTLHDPMDCSLPGSSVHGIFQARVLEWVAIAFSVWPGGRPELLVGWQRTHWTPVISWELKSGIRSGRVEFDEPPWFCLQPSMWPTCWKKDQAENFEGVLCLSQKTAFGSEPQRMRTSSIWDPVEPTVLPPVLWVQTGVGRVRPARGMGPRRRH